MVQYFDLAEYYEYDQAFDFDLDFYRTYARQCQPPALELACGTGRLTIPLAQDGIAIHGLDNAEPMLARCRAAVADQQLQDQVTLHLADMAGFDLPRKDFGLIFIALRSYMHLLSRPEQEACLQHAHQHLHPAGLLIVDVIAPDLALLGEKPSQFYTDRHDFTLPNGSRVVRQIRLLEHDQINQVRHFEFKFEEYDPQGSFVRLERVPVSTRYLFRYELQLLLEAAGFKVVDVYRDYNRNAYDGTGEMIMVAKKGQ